MKLKLLFVAAALAVASAASAQTSYEDIHENVNKAGGIYYVDDFSQRDLTPAPRGFKPCYISAYLRHGARHVLDDHEYTDIHKTFSAAAKAGALTEEGMRFYRKFEEIYPTVKGRHGELTQVGFQQHRDLAERMYRNYPGVFKGKAHVEAFATDFSRVILSMNSFLGRLRQLNPDLDMSAKTGPAYLRFLNPQADNSPYNIYPYGQEMKQISGKHSPEFPVFCAERLDLDAMVARFFSKPSAAEKYVEKFHLMADCYTFVADLQCIRPGESMWDFFTEDEIMGLWEVDNYHYIATKGYYEPFGGFAPDFTWQILDDIITMTDKDLAEGNAARLRFGHDGLIMATYALMGIGKWGAHTADRHEVKELWHVYDIPAASNMQIIFYKNRKGEIIFKFLHNEKNVELPIKAWKFPYYRWEDFKSHYLEVIDEAKKNPYFCNSL